MSNPATASPRPLWFLGPGGMPIPAGSKGTKAKGVTHSAFEGDSQWTPIEPEPRPTEAGTDERS